MADRFDLSLNNIPFQNYGEYMEYLFACVNMAMEAHLTQMKAVFATGQGGYKNVLYPDLEVASDICSQRIRSFQNVEEVKSEESNDMEISDQAIILKTEIEKVREQIQNIE